MVVGSHVRRLFVGSDDDGEDDGDEDFSDSEDNDDGDNVDVVPPSLSATGYHAMSAMERRSHNALPGEIIGYNSGFPLDLCSSLRVALDIDSTILVRDTYSEMCSVFEGAKDVPVVKAHVDIKPNPGSFGIQLQIDDTQLGCAVNKDLSQSCSYELCEITHSNVSHKLHMIVLDGLLWKRKRRQKDLEKKVGEQISMILRQALERVRRSPYTSESDRHTLAGCNLPSTDRKASAISENGVRRTDVNSQPSPKWQISSHLMSLIAKVFDDIVADYIRPADAPLPSSASSFGVPDIMDCLQKSSMFILSTAGIKGLRREQAPVKLTDADVADILSDISGVAAPSDRARAVAYVKLETHLHRRVVNNPVWKKYIEATIVEYLYPGLESGPVYLDLGYLVYLADSPHLVMLPRNRESCAPIKGVIDLQANTSVADMDVDRVVSELVRFREIGAASKRGPQGLPPTVLVEPSVSPEAQLEDAVDEYYGPEDEDEEELLRVLGALALSDPTQNNPPSVESVTLDDDHDIAFFENRRDQDGHGLRSQHHSEIAANMSNEDGFSDEDDDPTYRQPSSRIFRQHGFFGDTIVAEQESPAQVEELLAEASLSNRDHIASALSSSDNLPPSNVQYPASIKDLLHRPCPNPTGYLFGTPFGNIYTGYPRVIHTGLRRSPDFIPPDHHDGHIRCGKILHPKEGAVSAVMYAHGLKNHSVGLTHNIKSEALNGFAAVTALIVEESYLLGAEWRTVYEKWKDMYAIVLQQEINETIMLCNYKEAKSLVGHRLRLEFRTCINVAPKDDTDSEDEDDEALFRGTRLPSFEIPWPMGVVWQSEVEHSERYHQFRCDSMEQLMIPLKRAHSKWKEGQQEDIHAQVDGIRSLIVGSAGVLENFINIFSRPSCNRYLLFRNQAQIRKFYHGLDALEPDNEDDNSLGLEWTLRPEVTSSFFRSNEDAKRIDPKRFQTLKSRARRIVVGDPAGETEEAKVSAKANRLTRLERCQRDILQRYHYGRTKLIDPTGFILCRQRLFYLMKTKMAEWTTKPNAPAPTRQASDDPNDEEPAVVLEEPAVVLEERPRCFWWDLPELQLFMHSFILRLMSDVYYHEYDIVMSRNECYASTFSRAANDSDSDSDDDDGAPPQQRVDAFDDVKNSIIQIKQMMEDSPASNRGGNGFFVTQPFGGLNNFRRQASLKTTGKDAPLSCIGECEFWEEKTSFESCPPCDLTSVSKCTLTPFFFQMIFSTVFSVPSTKLLAEAQKRTIPLLVGTK